MRKILLGIAASVAILAIGSINANRAEAMALPAPAGLLAAIEDTALITQVPYICSRVWRCGYYGCGPRRVCWWRPGYGFGPGYGFYRPYRRWWGG